MFESNPYQSAFNGSLWTLQFELAMYAGLLILYVIAQRVAVDFLRVFRALVIGIGFGCLVYLMIGYFRRGLPEPFELHRVYRTQMLAFMFFTGGGIYLARAHIVLSSRIGLMLAFLIVAASANRHIFFVVYLLFLPYALFCFAYLLDGKIRAFNRLGDYSYGLYIYAFPVQQAIVSSVRGIDITALMIYSFLASLTLAVLSWHLVEERALGQKANLHAKINGFRY